MADTTVIRCPTCGANNRVSIERIADGDAPVCGRCKSPLPLMNHAGPVVISDAAFVQEVERSAVPVLIDMWAPWCGPCKLIAPIIDQLASEMGGKVKFAKMNVDENPHTAGRFNVSSIPTLLIMKGGKEVDRIVGVQPALEIRRRLERATG